MKMNKLIIRISTVFLLLFLLKPSHARITLETTKIDTISIVTNIDTPWEILWGPDNWLWFTERAGKVSRINPYNYTYHEIQIIDEVFEERESGLLGMVLHPDFIDTPYVYLVYNYWNGKDTRERLVRYTFENNSLTSPDIFIDDIDGHGNHNGSRLIIDENYKLFMTTGDVYITPNPQDLSSLNGKILRLNLDGSVPEDNPIPGSYLWTWGHRNPQGLVKASNGVMYSSEHGPANDDELNIIMKGRNYGWPNVEGFCDGVAENAFCADSNVVEPVFAWTPTLAVAGIDYYNHPLIPEWKNSILMSTLKAKELVQLKLSEDGLTVNSTEKYFDNWWGRLRDVCVSPDGRVFIGVSNKDQRGDPQPGDDRIVELRPEGFSLDTFFIYDTVKVYDTLTVYDTLWVNDTITIYDTIRISDTIRVFDTIQIFDYITDIDTIFVYDTIRVYDTIWINDTIVHFDTIPVYDSIKVYDTVYVFDTLITDTSVLLKDKSKLNFTIYPNPAIGEVKIMMDSSGDSHYLQIFDPSGRIVLADKLFTREYIIPEGRLRQGMYIIKISDERRTGQQLLMIR